MVIVGLQNQRRTKKRNCISELKTSFSLDRGLNRRRKCKAAEHGQLAVIDRMTWSAGIQTVTSETAVDCSVPQLMNTVHNRVVGQQESSSCDNC